MKSIELEYIREIHYKDAKSLLSAISYGGELYDSFLRNISEPLLTT